MSGAIAVVQARMGSTRLPGKVLRDLCGVTVLGHVIQRLAACPELDGVIVATTDQPSDDAIVREARRHGAGVTRGSESDVLARYFQAAGEHDADPVVRVTSDCPLIDPVVLQQMLKRYRQVRDAKQGIDYLSNTIERTFPRGLDAEIVARSALERAHREARAPHQREHVTPYIWEHPDEFVIEHFRSCVDHSNYRWTLDTEDDWKLLEVIFGSLGRDGRKFDTEDVLRLFAVRPELALINAHVEQKKVRP